MSNAKFIWFVLAVAANVLTAYVIVRGFIDPDGLASVSWHGQIDKAGSLFLQFCCMAIFVIIYATSIVYFLASKPPTNE